MQSEGQMHHNPTLDEQTSINEMSLAEATYFKYFTLLGRRADRAELSASALLKLKVGWCLRTA